MKKKEMLRFVIFCFVGGSSALVHMIVFNIFLFILALKGNFQGISFNFIVATIMATSVAIIYNFSMNRNITFSAKGHPIKKQFLKFLVVYGISISINFLVSFSIIRLIGETTLNSNIATFSGIIASIPFSYFGSLLWAFKKKEELIIVS
ncbi:GtrA family protein [archaeon]|jgi:putative flippase GtrA|nr:GtrA family protein [archaeon]MBT4242099.1 GtrA family protein [archaeon]MBT4417787.1 GtrA family protein [archaeon]